MAGCRCRGDRKRSENEDGRQRSRDRQVEQHNSEGNKGRITRKRSQQKETQGRRSLHRTGKLKESNGNQLARVGGQAGAKVTGGKTQMHGWLMGGMRAKSLTVKAVPPCWWSSHRVGLAQPQPGRKMAGSPASANKPQVGRQSFSEAFARRFPILRRKQPEGVTCCYSLVAFQY
jgi:hypothetical protein